ncbi:hypothetical protein BJ322DRAFT_1023923 [Thelephora terrestris]|uniref:HMG box domain-containing protein n=1 Tax=Thelephora terrestris TaxID=56493 RepID=A0A9P6L269_9AGAM|nr:hypothetical protein BJ322DRAFT_1023923 [Thelephora terrestris]
MDSQRPATLPYLNVGSEASSPEAQTPARPLPEPRTPDNNRFLSLWGYSSPVLDSSRPVAISFTSALSLPSTPSTASSPMSGSPDYMQHYAIPPLAMDAADLVSSPVPPFRLPDGKRKKIPRPPNAFMLFRSWLIRHGKLPPEVERRQQHISKIAGKAWRLLDESTKDGWRDQALKLVQEHERKYPNNKHEPSPKNHRTGLEKIQRVAKDSKDDTARRLKALTDFYAHDHRAAGPRRPRRERTSPYKFPVTEQSTQRPARGSQALQLASGSPTMPPLINFDSPSVQSPSPSPRRAQPHGFAQEMPRQPLPYRFLPPGIPNHPHQARHLDDGTIVFSESYAPIQSSPSPPWYDTGMFPMANTDGMMSGPAANTTAAMLGLYELSPPYAHFNPNLSPSRNGFPVHQPPARTFPVPPTAISPLSPLSTAPLTAHEQEVFQAILKDSQHPFTLENLVPPSSPSPLSVPAEEVSFAKPQTGNAVSAKPRSSACP